MKKTGVAIALAVALVLSMAGTVSFGVLYHREVERNEKLESQLVDLVEKENEAAVMQSINAQMEEIADQERRVSDRQREEAIEQRKLAEEERQNAERQQREAEEQRQNAIAAEQMALDASGVAQRQRTIAEEQRTQAEQSKRMADTLSYTVMARNLGSLAMTQNTTGNHQLADLLAYAAYTFTQRYGGDVYNPAIYQALSMTSASMKKWNVGKGAVMKMWGLPNSKTFATVSTYGEITFHTKTKDGNLNTENIFRNSQYDFRDLVIDKKGTLYALSHTGHLVYGKRGDLRTMVIEGAQKPFRLFIHTDGELLVVAQQSIHLLQIATMSQVRRLPLHFTTTVAGEDDHQLLLFDKQGHAYTVDNKATKLTPKKLPFDAQPITSYTYSWRNGYEAFGTKEGVIIIIDDRGNVHRLIGHGSRVTRVKFDGNRLYSTSYDGTVRFWPFTQQRIEPVTVINTNQWIVSFAFDETMRYIWTADQNGNLTETLIDPYIMAEKIHDDLKREFTPEEWDYYVGKEIPYRKLRIEN